MNSIESGLKVSRNAIALNIALALVKVTTGIVGNSYALVADGIESSADVVSSLIVWAGLRIAIKPADEGHPYGHGKAESMAGMVIAIFLLIVSVIIALQSIQKIQTPQQPPAWYTLPVLAGIIITKELLFQKMSRVGKKLGSNALVSDAWHHRSDAITSVAAFVGITIALIGGEGYEAADAWAALLACVVIMYNGVHLLLPALNEVMDGVPPAEVEDQIRQIASAVAGVVEIEKCRIRKSGMGLLMDIHVVVQGDISVRAGHQIGHAVKNQLLQSPLPITDVVIHVEPDQISVV